jgi:2-amino-4-hydroxy-6-hydroxymethyldihydropteridine diphosphokinase
MTRTAYIGLGSNLGDRLQNCTDALEAIQGRRGIDVVKVSGWYETKAERLDGTIIESDPHFLNGAAAVETKLSPEKLLQALLDAEEAMGRPRKREKGMPRTVDIDLLLYENEIRNKKGITLPHPSMGKRLFVLKPLYDIAPKVVDPVSGKTVEELMNDCLKRGTLNWPTRIDDPIDDVEWE